MATAYYRTRSNHVTVTDPLQVQEILNEYQMGHAEMEGDRLLTGDTFSIRTPELMNAPFYVEHVVEGERKPDATEEMYERIAEYLTEPLEITTVQTHGVFPDNVTTVVTPDGEIETVDNSSE